MTFITLSDAVKKDSRRILVIGSPGTGKTSLSFSASQFAGETFPSKPVVDAKDVAYLCGDAEGYIGGRSSGFICNRISLYTECGSWSDYQKQLVADVTALKPLVDAGEIKFVVIDLALPMNLIHQQLKPDNQREWGALAAEGRKLFMAFNLLTGCTIIGNAQLKASASPGETGQAIDASNAKAVGGARSTFSMDLFKGIGQPWIENSSLMLTREVKMLADGKREYATHVEAGKKFPAKSRFSDSLAPTLPGGRTLNSILKAAYGDLL